MLMVEPGSDPASASASGDTRIDGQGRRRVQIDFSPAAYARLDSIRERSDAQSNAETVRNALRLYDWFLRQREEGYEVRLVKGDEERAVELRRPAPGKRAAHPHGRTGEVYVLAVAGRARGTGLGSALTAMGLHHLEGLGLSTVMLYVDLQNTGAVAMYERLGFVRADCDVQFALSPG